jgi:hypothetical protein
MCAAVSAINKLNPSASSPPPDLSTLIGTGQPQDLKVRVIPPAPSDTPRTDEYLETFYRDTKYYAVVGVGFARALETELSAALARAEQAEGERDDTCRHMDLARKEAGCPDDDTLVMHYRDLQRQLAEAKAQLEEGEEFTAVRADIVRLSKENESLRAQLAEVTRERDEEVSRLRKQNKKHAEARDRKESALLAQLEDFKQRQVPWERLVTEAKEKMLNEPVTWTNDPPSKEPGGWWRYSSLQDKAFVIALLAQLSAALAAKEEAESKLRP